MTNPDEQTSTSNQPDAQKTRRPAYTLKAINGALPAQKASNKQPAGDPFLRAKTEDDDGYDPYSDRPPTPEPLFQEDPWR